MRLRICLQKSWIHHSTAIANVDSTVDHSLIKSLNWSTLCPFNLFQYFTCCANNHSLVTDAHRYGGEFIGNRYGAGSGAIWLNNVHCNGTETDIRNCEHDVWGSHNCTHSQDVSVSCVTGITTVYSSKHDRDMLLKCSLQRKLVGSELGYY